MAWTAPRTWVDDEVVTATLMNTHVRDNLLMLENKYQTTLPASPFDGQWTILVDSVSAPSYAWQLRYNATAGGWAYMGGRPGFSQVDASETCSSSSYVALATPGPSFSIPVGGWYMVEIGANFYYVSGAFGWSYMSYDIGATGAVDGDGIVQQITAGSEGYMMRPNLKAFGSAATLTMKYKASGSDNGFGYRWMRVTPVTL